MATTSGGRHWGGFILSGGTAFLVDTALTTLLVHWGGVDRFLARIAAIACAMVVAWLMHRRVTFAMEAGRSWREFARYVGVALSANILNFAVYSAALLLVPTLHVIFAIVIATGVATVFSYLGFRLGVFREPVPPV